MSARSRALDDQASSNQQGDLVIQVETRGELPNFPNQHNADAAWETDGPSDEVGGAPDLHPARADHRRLHRDGDWSRSGRTCEHKHEGHGSREFTGSFIL